MMDPHRGRKNPSAVRPKMPKLRRLVSSSAVTASTTTAPFPPSAHALPSSAGDAACSADARAAAKARTADVICEDNCDKDFGYFQLKSEISEGLSNARFYKPSPIQVKAIPVGKVGLDLILQAKSGTGKTLVYVVIALQMVDTASDRLQCIVLTPTREVAVQGARVALEIGARMPRLKVATLIGGMPIAEDRLQLKRCHVAVGTPGRIKQLIDEGVMDVDGVRLLILDEADKLMEASFKNAVTWMFNRMPSAKQFVAVSATYPPALAKLLTAYMKQPTHVRLGAESQVLVGLAQFAVVVPAHPQPQRQQQVKTEALVALLTSVAFGQALVFSNYSVRAQAMCEALNNKGWPAIFIAASQTQERRLQAINSLKQFQCRILLSTDLTARGIDAANVDLVVNVDVPWESVTYLHRIGRAGRFGSYGTAVTIVSEGSEYAKLRETVFRTGSDIRILPKDLAAGSGDVWKAGHEHDGLEQVEPLAVSGDESFGGGGGGGRGGARRQPQHRERSDNGDGGGGAAAGDDAGKVTRRRSRKKAADEAESHAPPSDQRGRTRERLAEAFRLSLTGSETACDDVGNGIDQLQRDFDIVQSEESAKWESRLSATRRQMSGLSATQVLQRLCQQNRLRRGEDFGAAAAEEKKGGGGGEIGAVAQQTADEWRQVSPSAPAEQATLSADQVSERALQNFIFNRGSSSSRTSTLSQTSSDSSSSSCVSSSDEDEAAANFPFPFPDPETEMMQACSGYPPEWRRWFRRWYGQVARNRDAIHFMEYWKNMYGNQT